MEKDNEKEEGVVILSLSDERLRKVTQALSNETAVRIVEKLLERSMSATELAEALNMPLTTVKYNLDMLVEAELIKVKYKRYSKKGREIKYYAPVKRALVLMPEKTRSGIIDFLKRALFIFVISIPISLCLQSVWVRFTSVIDHEVILPPTESIFWMWFIAGVVFTFFIYIVIESLLGLRRRRIKIQ